MVAIHWGALIWTTAWIHMQTFLRANLLAAQMASGGSEAGPPSARPAPRSPTSATTPKTSPTSSTAWSTCRAASCSPSSPGSSLGMADARAAAVLLLPLRRGRSGDAHARRPDQGVPRRRSCGDRGGDGAGRRRDGGGDDDQGERRHRLDARPPARARRGAAARPATRDRVLDETRAGVQSGCRRRRAGTGPDRVGDGDRLGNVRARRRWRCSRRTSAGCRSCRGWSGGCSPRRKQSGVAFDRMRRLVADEHAPNTTRPRDLPVEPGDVRERPAVERPERVPLQRLDVVDLSAIHDGGAGVRNVSISIAPGPVRGRDRPCRCRQEHAAQSARRPRPGRAGARGRCAGTER